jgi:uncharacterized membrane protein YhaH (DUF805 family)
MYIGRLGRMHFFIWTMLIGLVTVLLNFLITPDDLLKAMMAGEKVEPPFYIMIILILTGAVLEWHLYVRRLHDLGVSGWWLALCVLSSKIPLIGAPLNILFYLVLLFWSGTPGDNDYGPAPENGRGFINAYLNW